MKMATNLV